MPAKLELRVTVAVEQVNVPVVLAVVVGDGLIVTVRVCATPKQAVVEVGVIV